MKTHCRITRQLRHRGIRPAEVATWTGLSVRTVYDRYSGRTRWSVDELEAIADRLGVTMDDLAEVTP